MDDKINGIIYGHALGDALGAPIEFFPFAHYTGILDSPITRYTRAYGKQVSAIGQITDDTEMALILLNTIKDGYTEEKAVVNYMLWANNNFENCKGNSPFMGNNTRNLFVAPKPTYKLYCNRFKKYYPDDIIKENSQSNGALMRSYSLAFVEDDEIIKTDVYITNPSKLVYNAVYTYITAIRMAMKDKSKDKIQKIIREMIEFNELLTAFDQAVNNIFRDVTVNRGHILHAYYCAFWGLFQFNNYTDAIDAIICLGPEEGQKAKIGIKGKWKKNEIFVGDTDTNASIAGALLGAFYGYEKITENEITKENMNIMMNCDSTKGDIVRPVIYKLPNINITN